MFKRLVSSGMVRRRPARSGRTRRPDQRLAGETWLKVEGQLNREQAFHLGQFALQFLH